LRQTNLVCASYSVVVIIKLFSFPDSVEEKKDILSDEKNVPSAFQTRLVSTLSSESLMLEIESMLSKNSIIYTKKGFVYKCKSYVCNLRFLLNQLVLIGRMESLNVNLRSK
jgi:hypothetical protein